MQRIACLHYAAPVVAWKRLRVPCQECDYPWSGQEVPQELMSDWEPSRDSLSTTCGGSAGTFSAFHWLVYILCLFKTDTITDDSPLHLILSS